MFVKSSRKFPTHGYFVCQVSRKSTASPKLKPAFSSEDYQYIQKSQLPTLFFQNHLMRCPIPTLEKSCAGYLKTLKPLLNDEDYLSTQNVVQEFEKTEGVPLQAAIEEKNVKNQHTSYISQPWFDKYLSDRTPLPLNYNPAIVSNRSNHPDAESQLCKAANVTISSLRFMKSLRSNILAPEIYSLSSKKNSDLFYSIIGKLPGKLAYYGTIMSKSIPLDMSQYSSLFNSTRIPQEGKDILVKDESGKHILVIRNGHFFTMNVLDDAGDILPPQDILTLFNYILSKDLKINENSVGILTTENRDVWARSRAHLSKISPKNEEFLKAIDSSLFVLCLDDKEVDDHCEILRNFLVGDGRNRWFDKCFSQIISKNGISAINFEHSWGDGVAVLRYIKDTFADINKNVFVNSETELSQISPENYIKKLDFSLDERITNEIRVAKQKFDDINASLGINVVEHKSLGRSACKKADISPDAMMQLAFQVAYHRIFGNFVPTYESCSTAMFKHGRTETMRPCTEETCDFAKSINGKNKPSKSDLIQKLRNCSEVHKNLTKIAAMGKGFERHLFALKYECEKSGQPLPKLFKHKSYELLNYNILSTSTLAAEEILLGGFGPVVPDGYGVGYTILGSRCGSIVTSYTAKRDGAQFIEALNLVFNELHELLTAK